MRLGNPSVAGCRLVHSSVTDRPRLGTQHAQRAWLEQDGSVLKTAAPASPEAPLLQELLLLLLLSLLLLSLLQRQRPASPACCSLENVLQLKATLSRLKEECD